MNDQPLSGPAGRWAFALLAAGLALWGTARAASPDAEPAWTLAGQQGLVRFVIVPTAQAADRDAHLRQAARLCEPENTCFINFYTNSTGAPVTLPLADAIDHEPTAVFRRSVKRGAETLRWSCRLKIETETCF